MLASLSNRTATPAHAGVVNHGSLVTVEDVQAIQYPVLFLQSDPALDMLFNSSLYSQVQQVLAAKQAMGLDANITYFPGQAHGFALRGNDADPAVAAAARDAVTRAVAFLHKHLAVT